METLEEKKRRLAKLSNNRELAEAAFRAAAQVEAQADAAGIAFKERKAASAPFADVPSYRGNPRTGIGSILRGE